MPKYIEQEAVIERLTNLMQLQAPTARAIIEAIPAADVRPVERRKDCRNLLDYESLFECSNCGWTSSDTYTADPMRYCPGCGARITENAKSGEKTDV